MPDVDRAKSILSAAADAGRLHHAVLLFGPSPAALEEVARHVAEKLLGGPPERHPDFFELRPEGKARMIRIGSEAERAGGEWPNNTMRRLLYELRQSSNAGGAKVAVICEADRMNAVAANAFLKTLEEPPRDTSIFMLTARPNELLETIRSRCVCLKVDAADCGIDDPEWSAWLGDFARWQTDLMRRRNFSSDAVIMRAYGLLSRFDSVLSRLSEGLVSDASSAHGEADAGVLEAVLAGERRGLRKKMLAQIEDTAVGCALGGDGVPAVKISRVVAALERCAGFMELNMSESAALEFFMISSIRIWTR
ncbi:MAG: hypothetical protein DBX55_02070 [Verrucomicrobia bacterium]|nr:MAG: hypothetical protein DBX55_02070 [Verrucomicrobiota bacterium]